MTQSYPLPHLEACLMNRVVMGIFHCHLKRSQNSMPKCFPSINRTTRVLWVHTGKLEKQIKKLRQGILNSSCCCCCCTCCLLPDSFPLRQFSFYVSNQSIWFMPWQVLCFKIAIFGGWDFQFSSSHSSRRT